MASSLRLAQGGTTPPTNTGRSGRILRASIIARSATSIWPPIEMPSRSILLSVAALTISSVVAMPLSTTSKPASVRARHTRVAPRQWPSRPVLAINMVAEFFISGSLDRNLGRRPVAIDIAPDVANFPDRHVGGKRLHHHRHDIVRALTGPLQCL